MWPTLRLLSINAGLLLPRSVRTLSLLCLCLLPSTGSRSYTMALALSVSTLVLMATTGHSSVQRMLVLAGSWIRGIVLGSVHARLTTDTKQGFSLSTKLKEHHHD